MKRYLGLGFAALSAAVVIAVVMTVFGTTAPTLARGRFTPRVDRPVDENGWLPIQSLLDLRQLSPPNARVILDEVDRHWRDGYAPMLLEAARFSSLHRDAIFTRLHKRTGVRRQAGADGLWRWVWQTKAEPHPNYAAFKAELYERIDQRFAAYFDDDRETAIRLDEVRWGGVVRDGIPPLKNPAMLPAKAASYLADTDVVFGIEVDGDARAYPKRILAWHEMFKDTVGGVSVNGVYCTLCGMMILYETEFDGEHHELGTSGFLYRSNKLMYDQATESMWSTTRGEPVVGPLVGKGIKLKTRSVVTTTWDEWRRRHPETTVLSLETGYYRDYDEGVAYHDYFATDRLMFAVADQPKHAALTSPIANKAEVLALRFGEAGETPVAIKADFLAANPVYQGEYSGQRYVVVTDSSGANRAYDAGELDFSPAPAGRDVLTDAAGGRWSVTEKALVNGNGTELPRLSAHRAFWFGWRAAHPNTRLIGG